MSRGGAVFKNEELESVLKQYQLSQVESTSYLRIGNPRAPKKLIKTRNGDFLLKRRPRGKDDIYHVGFSHSIQIHLEEKGFPVPGIVRTKKEDSSVHYERHVYELFHFIEGSRFDLSNSQTAAAGKALGEFHKAIVDFQLKWDTLKATYHDSIPVRKYLKSIPQTVKKKNSESSIHELREILKSTPAIEEITSRLLEHYNHSAVLVNQLGYDEWPVQIIHSDYHPGNMLFREDQVAAVFDFDSVKIAPSVCDVGNGILQFSITAGSPDPAQWPDHIDAGRMAAFTQGYQQVLYIEPDMKEALPDLTIETMIAESVLPIAATGLFGKHTGNAFLYMILRKCDWIKKHKKMLIEKIRQ